MLIQIGQIIENSHQDDVSGATQPTSNSCYVSSYYCKVVGYTGEYGQCTAISRQSLSPLGTIVLNPYDADGFLSCNWTTVDT